MDASLSVLWQQTTLMRRLDAIADNVANASTPGFKAEMVAYATKMGLTPRGRMLVQESIRYRDTREGAFTETGNPLDLAIQGEGYFVIDTPSGQRYTRNGRFTLDDQGQLVTSRGNPVLGDDGKPIFFAPTETDIRINTDGTVSTESGEIGTIGVVRFADEQMLERTPDGLFAGNALPEPAPAARIVQGAIEESNIEPVVQVTRMMSVLQEFQSAQRVIDAENERMRRMIQVLSGTR